MSMDALSFFFDDVSQGKVNSSLLKILVRVLFLSAQHMTRRDRERENGKNTRISQNYRTEKEQIRISKRIYAK